MKRVGFEFPFLDFLGDGYSSFRWAPAQLISSDHDIAVEGSRAYGTAVSRATWDPPCDAYRVLSQAPQAPLYFLGTAEHGQTVELTMAAVTSAHWPLELFKNVTNQPTFANGTTCGQMIRLFDTTLSAGEFAPRHVRGSVRAANVFPFEGEDRLWDRVYGIQLATPFIEHNHVDCRALQSYQWSVSASQTRRDL